MGEKMIAMDEEIKKEFDEIKIDILQFCDPEVKRVTTNATMRFLIDLYDEVYPRKKKRRKSKVA